MKEFEALNINYRGVNLRIDSLEAAQRFLNRLDAFGDDCSDKCKQLREELRAALNTDYVEREAQ